eukprot:GILJ01003876.1.p1 GENE.GILJ01003876.1~~GILJ01003876.1.p1  ORF type:complete len:394 (+),score=24.06 GILJ01003876.1:119-1300(+)
MGSRRLLNTRGNLSVLVLGNGAAGAENQALGLADALQLPSRFVRCPVPSPWSKLPAYLHSSLVQSLPARMSLVGLNAGENPDIFKAPFPDLVIGCGRTVAPVSVAIRRLSNFRSFTIQIQNPRASSSLFDLIVTPEHDNRSLLKLLAPSNVVFTRGALHRVTPSTLRDNANVLQDVQGPLNQHVICILLGGASKYFPFTADMVRELANTLISKLQSSTVPLTVVISPSRRTPSFAAPLLMNELLAAHTHSPLVMPPIDVKLWTQSSNLPLLAAAHSIIVTSDSISMMSESMAANKPVFVTSAHMCTGKLKSFVQSMLSNHSIQSLEHFDAVAATSGGAVARPFVGLETEEIARVVLERLHHHRSALVGKSFKYSQAEAGGTVTVAVPSTTEPV